MKALTVGELKGVIKDIPDDVEVRLSSDTGVDQGEGRIIIESAYHVKYGSTEYLSIYANDVDDFEEEEGEE